MADVISILKKVGGILQDDHFVYTSGRHGSVYLNKDALYPHTDAASGVGKLFAEKHKDLDIDVVVAPAVGGTILSQWTAHHLSAMKKKEILAVYTEKDKGTTASAAESEHIFRRGYDKLVRGKKILILEDLTMTGMSVKKVVQAVKKTGGTVVAVSVMINRDPKNVNEDFVGAPFSALGEFDAGSFDPSECPLCKKGVPVNTSVGHGRKFIESKK